MDIVGTIAIALAGFAALIIYSAVKIVSEYERGVIFRLGRLMGARGPGLFFIIPIIERMVRVDLRVVTMDIPSQEVITRDNVTISVNAVLYFKIVDPNLAVTAVNQYAQATYQISQTTLRNVVGQSELDELLGEREKLNQRMQEIIDETTEPWGVKVTIVEVKDVELPPDMQRAMARQAEAERDRRAKIITAEGEFQASQRLHDAGVVLSAVPATMQLRYLQTLTTIAADKNSTIVFPVPLDILSALTDALSGSSQRDADAGPTDTGAPVDTASATREGIGEAFPPP